MKKLIISTLFLAIGLIAYPQGSRSSRDAKSNKAKSSQVTSRSSSRSKPVNVKKSNSQSRSKATSPRSTPKKSAVKRSNGSKTSGTIKKSSPRSSTYGKKPHVSKSVSTTRRAYSDSRTVSKSRSTSSSVKSTVKTVSNNPRNDKRKGIASSAHRDGRTFRNQNDDVFVKSRYRVDYRDASHLRSSRDFVKVHNHYYNWHSRRHVRKVKIHNHYYSPLSIEIRRVKYPYRTPAYLDLCWTPHLHYNFMFYYPLHSNWNSHSYGEYIETTSSYEAANYIGTVKRVYGKVAEVFYSPEDKAYTLYFGAMYPYQDFSVVIPKKVAKRFSMSPSWYFEDEHVWVVGLIESWDGRPEIVIHEEQQIRRY